MELGAFGDGPQGLHDNGWNVVADIGQAVHGANIHAAVPSVAVIHDVAYPVAQRRCLVHLAGIQHPNEIGLNLEVDVVGMRVVFPVSAFRSAASAQNIVAGGLVGVPKLVVGTGKGVGIGLHRSVQSLFQHGFHEGEVHVNVVVKARVLDVRIVNIVVVPGDGNLLHDEPALVLELRGAAIGTADGLAVPSAFDLVYEGCLVNGDGLAIGHLGCLGAGCQEQECTNYGNTYLHSVFRCSIQLR